MKRFLLYGIVVGSFLACAAAVLLFTIGKTSDIGASAAGQTTQVSCGQWCVHRCSWILGAPVDMDEVIQLLPSDPAGHSLAQLRDVLERVGFQAVGYRESFDTFRQGEFPCIVHVRDPNHFVVAAGRLKTGMLVFDGDGMRRRVTEKVLRQGWTGNVLRVQRSPDRSPLPRFKDRSTDGAPCIQFETLHVDQGDVPIGRPIVSFVYPFANRGSEPLVVGNVHTDCTCLEVEKPDAPIPPGAGARIVLKYSAPTGGKRGLFQHEAVVESNDPTYPRLPIYASGNTDARVTFAPRVIDFGRIVRGRAAVAFCHIRYTGDDFESFQITNCRCSLPEVELRTLSAQEYQEEAALRGPATPSRDLSDRVRIVRLTYNPSADPGRGLELSGTFEFETNVEDVGAISVPVQGRVVSPVAAVPSALDFGELCGQPDAKASASLVLRSRDGTPFRVLNVEPPEVGKSLEFSWDQRGEEVALEVVCDEALALEAHKSTLSIHLQLGDDQQPLVLPVVMYAWRAASEDRG